MAVTLFRHLTLAGCVYSLACGAVAQTTSHDLLHEAIEVLSTNALGRERIDWVALEAELRRSLRADAPAQAAHAAITEAVKRLNDPHARYIIPEPIVEAPPTTPEPTEPSEPTRNSEAPKHPPIPVLPEGKMLDDGCAYLVIPGCPAPDVAGLRAFARALSDQLDKLNKDDPRAWIIDLRLNAGGNLWPMLLGLEPILGRGAKMTMVTNERVQSRFGVSRDSVWVDWGVGPESQLDWGSDGAPQVMPYFAGRVGVLIGPWTMSSGEALAICLASRANTRTFGEPTAGLTTVTNTFQLSDGSVLNIPVSQVGDHTGAPIIGPVKPMQPEKFGDWPSEDDEAARAARRWALEQP